MAVDALQHLGAPIQIVWAVADPVLRVETHGEQAHAATARRFTAWIAKHFLQADRATDVVEHVRRLVVASRGEERAAQERT